MLHALFILFICHDHIKQEIELIIVHDLRNCWQLIVTHLSFVDLCSLRVVATIKNSSINLVKDECVICGTLVTNFIEQEEYNIIEENPYNLKKRKNTSKI